MLYADLELVMSREISKHWPETSIEDSFKDINWKRCASLLIWKELWHESKLSFNFKVKMRAQTKAPNIYVSTQGYNKEFGSLDLVAEDWPSSA